MARTKRSLEKLAARREADAVLEAARRQHLAALEIAANAATLCSQGNSLGLPSRCVLWFSQARPVLFNTCK